MAFSPETRTRLESAAFIRHGAIFLAAVAAYVFREHVRFGNEALWIIGATGAFNLLMSLVAGRPGWTRSSLVLSPCFGLVGWTILVQLTGGVSSFFIAGFWLEIVLSAWTCSTAGTLWVTAGASAALWAQACFSRAGLPIRPLLLQTGFLVAMGGVMLLLTRQWTRAQSESSRRHAEVMGRLRALENEMEVLRSFGEAGENVALLAHALKNAIASLRGFAALLDARHGDIGRNAKAFEGLCAAIDRLEEIARVTLGRSGSGAGRPSFVDGAETRRLIEETLEEVSLSYPQVGWRKSIAPSLPDIRADRVTLREALLNLARNAAEAMNGSGEITVETVIGKEEFEIRIRDEGSGLAEQDLTRTLKPGFTTKPGGSGLGLFLTRRLVESFGGHLSVAPASGGGAVVSIGLPQRRGEETP